MTSNTQVVGTTSSSRSVRPNRDRAGSEAGRPGPDVATLLGLPEAAARLRVKESFIRRLVAERRIPYYKVGRYLRFDPAELDAFVLRSRVAPREHMRWW